MSRIDLSATLKCLKATAATQVALYPQYAGHFEDYRLVRVKRDITTKAGLAFAKGEYALAIEREDELPNLPSNGQYVVAWSRRNKVDIHIRATEVEWLTFVADKAACVQDG